MNCRECETELTDANWYPSLKKKGCRICGVCNAAKSRKWREENRAKANAMARKYSNAYPDRVLQSGRKNRVKTRLDMVAAYGGQCAHCGINDQIVLDIDHIENNGSEHRKMGYHGWRLYRWLKTQGYPKNNYQLLCKNCNWRKEILRRRPKEIQDEKHARGHAERLGVSDLFEIIIGKPEMVIDDDLWHWTRFSKALHPSIVGLRSDERAGPSRPVES